MSNRKIVLRKEVPGNFVDLTHARVPKQRAVMKKIRQAGVCPFCPKYLKTYHSKPIVREGAHWVITENDYPYKGTRIHLLGIHKKHLISPTELDPKSKVEMFDHLGWATKEYKIKGGTALMRFGDTRFTGGSVAHLHFHIFTGGTKKESNNKPINAKIGYHHAGK